jgi:hypothetical protein
MQLPVVLVLDAGNPDNAPHLGLPEVIAQQELQQLVDVEPVGLGPSFPPRDLDAGGIDDDIVDSHFLQSAMDPETVSSRFVAGKTGAEAGRPKRFFAWPISFCRVNRSPAGTSRSRAF